MGVFFYLFIKISYLRNIIIHYQNNPVSTAIALDRCATGVPHTLEDPKISKPKLALSNLGFSDIPTDRTK